jgi:hypothetical protein
MNTGSGFTLTLTKLRAVGQQWILLDLLRGLRLERLGNLGEIVAFHHLGDADGTRRIAFELKPSFE